MNNELYEKLARLQWLVHKQHLRDHRRGNRFADPARGQGRILTALQMKDGISTKDLSYLLGLAISSLNESLAKLEKKGFITREPSEQDKRVMLVMLTDKGRAKQERHDDPAKIEDLFACLSEEEQVVLGELLDRLTASLGAKQGLDDDELEWLKINNAKRDRMFAEMMDADERGFRAHDFRGGHGSPNRHGGYYARGGFDPRDPRCGYYPERKNNEYRCAASRRGSYKPGSYPEW
ncbi:MAG: MarR family transcriptional regulator [Coriobacteriia bacterium]|nr:MarR family transcriptional regulator [Coriobacteriia bacterium]